MDRHDSFDLLGIPAAEARLIRYFLIRPDARAHLREVQRVMGLGGASVQRALNRLVELGALDRTEEDGRTLFSVISRAPIWRALRLIESGAKDPVPLMREVLVDVPGIGAAFIFGSMATGDIHDESDVDVLVVEHASMERRKLNQRTAQAGILLGRQVNTVRYTPEELGERLGDRSSPAWAFVHAVLRGPKEWIAGAGHTLVPLAAAAGISRDELLGGAT
jgi:predicted nucleotidyltransferase